MEALQVLYGTTGSSWWKTPLISHILAHDSLSEQERGKKGKQEMQFVDDKKELRMKNRESIP